MRTRMGIVVLTVSALASVAMAEAPASSLRPQPRPIAVDAAAPLVAALRPKPRASMNAADPGLELAISASGSTLAPAESSGQIRVLRPSARPRGLTERALAAAAAIKVAPGKQGVVSKKGSVCGDPGIKGETLAPITSKVQGCGVAKPVKITSVAGVRLSQPATLDCDTAHALKTWVEKGLGAAYGRGKIVELQVAGHYVCRTRNHKAGAKVSEHGRGRAIDIAGFVFSNGKSVSVRRNYDKSMRKAHKAACGIFGTTLGPGSDGMHEDHLHFDTASYRGGPYCR